MEIALVLLGIVAALAVGGCLWLGLQRAKASRDAGELRGRLTASEAEADRLRTEQEAARAEAVALSDKARELGERAARLQTQLEETERRHTDALASQEARFAEREASVKREREAVEQRIAELHKTMGERFSHMAGEALKNSSESFLKLAQQRFEADREKTVAEVEKKREAVGQLVRPIEETLKKTSEKLAEMEKARLEQHSTLAEQIKVFAGHSEQLRTETGKLARALSRPEVRGRYGEIQLRRVAELAGMVAYCDFSEQTSIRDTEGRLKRPDMVVKLPNERVIAVDAKCNIDPYVRAVDTSDEQEREQLLERFASGIADQAKKLAAKSYWSDYEGGAEFVVMFVPGDQFLDAALARRSDLLEIAAQQGVILASPATLIGLLRAVAVGWAEQRLAEEARELKKLGSELHERASVALDHAAKLGQTIDRAVRQYNQFMGSVDSRLMPTLRKFEEAGAASGKSLPDPAEIEVRPKLLNHANAEED